MGQRQAVASPSYIYSSVQATPDDASDRASIAPSGQSMGQPLVQGEVVQPASNRCFDWCSPAEVPATTRTDVEDKFVDMAQDPAETATTVGSSSLIESTSSNWLPVGFLKTSEGRTISSKSYPLRRDAFLLQDLKEEPEGLKVSVLGTLASPSQAATRAVDYNNCGIKSISCKGSRFAFVYDKPVASVSLNRFTLKNAYYESFLRCHYADNPVILNPLLQVEGAHFRPDADVSTSSPLGYAPTYNPLTGLFESAKKQSSWMNHSLHGGATDILHFEGEYTLPCADQTWCFWSDTPFIFVGFLAKASKNSNLKGILWLRDEPLTNKELDVFNDYFEKQEMARSNLKPKPSLDFNAKVVTSQSASGLEQQEEVVLLKSSENNPTPKKKDIPPSVWYKK